MADVITTQLRPRAIPLFIQINIFLNIFISSYPFKNLIFLRGRGRLEKIVPLLRFPPFRYNLRAPYFWGVSPKGDRFGKGETGKGDDRFLINKILFLGRGPLKMKFYFRV
jgi:hypothetical protein